MLCRNLVIVAFRNTIEVQYEEPVEKLWRSLRQELTHLHPWANDLLQLREEIDCFLSQFAAGSPDLLQYVGLGIPD